MNIQIITPDKTIYKGEVKLAQFPGLDGSFEVLNNHAAMISALKEGKIKVLTMDDEEKYFDIRGGVAEVLKNKILVLAE
nr:ATP synthase F1 subunit epsilon [Bacteroidota bacterium]